MKKTIVFVVLGIPVLIALILKFFGQNQFEIPVYYQQGLTSDECDIHTKDQYFIQEFVTVDGGRILPRGGICILYFHSWLNENLTQEIRELGRIISTKTMPEGSKVFALTSEEIITEMVSGSTLLQFDEAHLEDIARCNLLLAQSDTIKGQIDYSSIVLIDSTGRIRGYFLGSDEEEYDRLSAEVDILYLEGREVRNE